MDISAITFVLELIGTAAFAISGVIVARESEMDLLGAIVLGLATAVGGGMIRDTVLGHLPPNALVNPVYGTVAVAACVIMFCILYFYGNSHEESPFYQYTLELADCIGLAIFAVVGVQATLVTLHSDNAVLAVFTGVITAVGGGMIRDVLAGQVPFILKEKIYAVAALAGSCLYFALIDLQLVDPAVAIALSVAATMIIRLLSLKFGWNLPRLKKNSKG